jgi:hypothetical protein
VRSDGRIKNSLTDYEAPETVTDFARGKHKLLRGRRQNDKQHRKVNNMAEEKAGKKPENLGEGESTEEQEVGGKGHASYICWNCGAGGWIPHWRWFTCWRCGALNFTYEIKEAQDSQESCASFRGNRKADRRLLTLGVEMANRDSSTALNSAKGVPPRRFREQEKDTSSTSPDSRRTRWCPGTT